MSWKTEDFGFFVSRREGVDLLAIGGDKRNRADPLRLVVRVVGTATGAAGGARPGASTPLPDAVRCFEIGVYRSDVVVDDVDCPRRTPLRFPGPPRFPARIVERLRDTLPRQADPAKVRQAVSRLDLDRRITQEITVRDGTIGVALREGVDGTCLYARVGAGRVEVWHPYRIVPGGDDVESCRAVGAALGYFERANH
ncbi:hypothetical protein AB0D67_19385 [Streptosporangium sp. NPDC048047]|uniref:hypothetical protein n=1 Tax=Streptosporangium sp. NPDC048047 TaxID=3155748 RepID=UPI00343E23F0